MSNSSPIPRHFAPTAIPETTDLATPFSYPLSSLIIDDQQACGGTERKLACPIDNLDNHVPTYQSMRTPNRRKRAWTRLGEGIPIFEPIFTRTTKTIFK